MKSVIFIYLYNFAFCHQVNSRKQCEDLFSEESLSEKGIPLWKRKQQLRYGMKSDISCVGNEFQEGVSILTIQIKKKHMNSFSKPNFIDRKEPVMETVAVL